MSLFSFKTYNGPKVRNTDGKIEMTNSGMLLAEMTFIIVVTCIGEQDNKEHMVQLLQPRNPWKTNF